MRGVVRRETKRGRKLQTHVQNAKMNAGQLPRDKQGQLPRDTTVHMHSSSVNHDRNGDTGHRSSTFTSRTADAFYAVCVSLRPAAIDYPRTALCGACRLDAPPHPRTSLLRCRLPSTCSSCGGYCWPLPRPPLCAPAACELTLQTSRDPRSPFPSSSNTATSRKCCILPLITSATSPSPTLLLKLCTSAN